MRRRALLAFFSALPFWRSNRLDAAVQELRAAMCGTDRARYMRAAKRLRRVTGTQREWELAAGRATGMAMLDRILEGTGYSVS